jgi:hypothetical protein
LPTIGLDASTAKFCRQPIFEFFNSIGQKRVFTPIVEFVYRGATMQSHAARDGCEAIEFAEAT